MYCLLWATIGIQDPKLMVCITVCIFCIHPSRLVVPLDLLSVLHGKSSAADPSPGIFVAWLRLLLGLKFVVSGAILIYYRASRIIPNCISLFIIRWICFPSTCPSATKVYHNFTTSCSTFPHSESREFPMNLYKKSCWTHITKNTTRHKYQRYN